MSDQDKARFHDDSDYSNMLPVRGTRRQPQRQAVQLLPAWKVILHNDDVNDMDKVVETIYQLTPLNREQASARMNEAHISGASLLLVTHRERAELYAEQFLSCRMIVTIEAAG